MWSSLLNHEFHNILPQLRAGRELTKFNYETELQFYKRFRLNHQTLIQEIEQAIDEGAVLQIFNNFQKL